MPNAIERAVLRGGEDGGLSTKAMNEGRDMTVLKKHTAAVKKGTVSQGSKARRTNKGTQYKIDL